MGILIIGGTGPARTAITRCHVERGDFVTLYPFIDAQLSNGARLAVEWARQRVLQPALAAGLIVRKRHRQSQNDHAGQGET